MSAQHACRSAARREAVSLMDAVVKASADIIHRTKLLDCLLMLGVTVSLGIYTAVRWFCGEKVEPVNYIAKKIITKDNVKEFMPAQW